MSMDRKQKQYLRAEICRLMDEERVDEARQLMDLLCPKKKLGDGDKRLRKVRLTDANGNVKEYDSITALAKAYNVSRGTVLRAINVGTPVSGVFAGYSVSISQPAQSKKTSRPGVAIRVISREGDVTTFESVSDAMSITGIGYAAFYKSIKDGTQVSKGEYRGWKFERVESI